MPRPQKSSSFKIRGHMLLCFQGFRGEGYSEEFVKNMKNIFEDLKKNPQSPILLLNEPDEVCQACPHLKNGCTLHGQDTETQMAKQDRDVLSRLGLKAGMVISWKEIIERIAKNISSNDLPQICGNCPWLPLGFCKSSIDDLK